MSRPRLHPDIAPLVGDGDGVMLWELSIEQARVTHEATTPLLGGDGPEMAETTAFELPGPGGPLPVRVYRPHGDVAGAVAFFHGGGWVVGSMDSVEPLCRHLAHEAGCLVLSVGYRLAPEHRFPAAVDDCLAATAWLAEHAADVGAPAGRLAVAGDSAGGNLAAVVARRWTAGGQRPALALQLLAYPVCDAGLNTPSQREIGVEYGLDAQGMKWFWDHYLGMADGADPDASPLRAGLDELRGLPPALVVTAELDPLRDEGEAYAERLREAGVEVELQRYDGTVHGFWRWLAVAEPARELSRHAGRALRRAFAA